MSSSGRQTGARNYSTQDLKGKIVYDILFYIIIMFISFTDPCGKSMPTRDDGVARINTTIQYMDRRK